MKYVKIMALVALAAMATMAVLASSASASAKVCSPTQGTGEACQAGHGKVYSGNIHAALVPATTAKLVSGFITVTCTESTGAGSVNGATGTGSLTSLTFNKCNSFLGACTAKTSASAANPWPVTVTTDGLSTSTDGLMDVSNITGEFTCAGETCRYINEATPVAPAPTIDGSTLSGGVHSTARIIASGVKLKREEPSGGLCSATATWTGTYSIDTPDSLVVE